MMRPRRPATTVMALATLLVALLAAPAAARDDDGGGRSVLADGVGNRALGLGGAYVAVADDASAVVWNPGGLGFVQRREFQASHTNLLGMGFSEQYVSFVLPDWRWGAASLTFRRFGVGGIEGRDDRNLITTADLSDSETELSLGYGRDLGAAWSVGGSLKLRKQNLAGYSDSGLGIDVGALVRPLVALSVGGAQAPDLTMGLAVRNLVEPSLRLNEDPVKDPLGIRVGAAYRWHFGREGELLASMDLEKTRDMNMHLHAGLEARVVRPLAVRVGVNEGRLVAGAGVSYNEMGIDYQFEDNPYGYFHRFGVSVKFGPTRTEAQARAMALEEQQLQQRLDAAFAGQQQQRKQELLAKTATDLRRDDAGSAANHLAMVKVIDPDAAELPPLESRILVLQATDLEAAGDHSAAMVALRQAIALDPFNDRAATMLERLRAAGDQQARRSAEVRGLLDDALDAFTRGELVVARDGFQQVLTLAPDDREAQGMLALSKTAIATRVEGHLAQVRILANARQFDRANAELAAARRLDAAAPGLDLAAKYLADQMVAALADRTVPAPVATTSEPAAAAPAATAVAAPTLTAQQQRELEDLYRRGVTAMEEGQMDQAVHYWELVWSQDPHYKSVTEYLGQNYLARGMESFVAGALADAVASWENAVRVHPDDPKALGYLQRAREQTERMRMLDD